MIEKDWREELAETETSPSWIPRTLLVIIAVMAFYVGIYVISVSQSEMTSEVKPGTLTFALTQEREVFCRHGGLWFTAPFAPLRYCETKLRPNMESLITKPNQLTPSCRELHGDLKD